jgi:hypothetical protein
VALVVVVEMRLDQEVQELQDKVLLEAEALV